MKKIIIILLVALLFTSFHVKPNNTKEQPNFLFVLVDDQPYDALGIYGRYLFLQTPNMDRLAKEGVLFENYFCILSICSPSELVF